MTKLNFPAIILTAIVITMLILPLSTVNAITREVNTLAEINEAIFQSQETGDIIRLTGNIDNNTNTAITIDSKEIILDLNGKTLSSQAISTLCVTGKGAKLIITDSDDNEKGTITNTSIYPAVLMEDGGSLMLAKGTIAAQDDAIRNVYGNNIDISGGSVTGSSCIYNNSNGDITITGGTLEASGIYGYVIYDYNMLLSTSGKISIGGDAHLRNNSSTQGTVTILCNSGHTDEILNVSGGSIINTASFGCAIDIVGGGGGAVKLSGDAEIGLVSIPELYIAGNIKLSIMICFAKDKRFTIYEPVTGDITIDGVNLTPEDTADGKIVAIATDASYIDESKFKLSYLPGRKLARSGSYLVFAKDSGIENGSTPKTTVFTDGNNIVVHPADTGDTVTVYDINGTTLCSRQCTNSELVIPVPGKGLYFVKTSTETTKVIVK